MKVRRILSKYKFKFIVYRDISKLFRLQKDHESKNSYILMEAHRLEKSMCQANQDPKRGYSRAISLLEYIEQVYLSKDRDNCIFAIETGIAVINAFTEYKAKIDTNSDQLLELNNAIKRVKIPLLCSSQYGGRVLIDKPSISYDTMEMLFKSRHSCRDFTNSTLDLDLLKRAVALAQYSPSACNRQPTRVYLVSEDVLRREKVENDGNEYAAPYHLIVTVDCTAYTYYDYNDWIVTGSIFTGYLTLALHSVGIGSCIVRKSLYESKHNSQLRSICKIPQNEKILIELYIGNYPDKFMAPISRRLNESEVLKIV